MDKLSYNHNNFNSNAHKNKNKFETDPLTNNNFTPKDEVIPSEAIDDHDYNNYVP